MKDKRSNEEWKATLAPEVYRVTREGGTELAFTGKYNKFYEDGKYSCSNCKQYLFDSNFKFDSGTGWPSFSSIATEGCVDLHKEKGSLTMPDRIEVKCAKCDAHLGHVFNDGPEPSGLRYCINSLALDFQAKK